MSENHLFEYAVIRVVPRVEREEFVNVGVILFCGKLKFLQASFCLDEKRLLALCQQLDVKEIESHLFAFDQICIGRSDAGEIAKLDPASRFRWLTATRSTVVQCSKVHPGFSIDLPATLEKLHQQLVLC